MQLLKAYKVFFVIFVFFVFSYSSTSENSIGNGLFNRDMYFVTESDIQYYINEYFPPSRIVVNITEPGNGRPDMYKCFYYMYVTDFNDYSKCSKNMQYFDDVHKDQCEDNNPAPKDIFDTACYDVYEFSGSSKYPSFTLVEKKTSNGVDTYKKLDHASGTCDGRGYSSDCTELNIKKDGVTYKFSQDSKLLEMGFTYPDGSQYKTAGCYDGVNFQPAPEINRQFTPEQWKEYQDSLRDNTPDYKPTDPDNPLNPNKNDPIGDPAGSENGNTFDPGHYDTTRPDLDENPENDNDVGGWGSHISDLLGGVGSSITNAVNGVGSDLKGALLDLGGKLDGTNEKLENISDQLSISGADTSSVPYSSADLDSLLNGDGSGVSLADTGSMRSSVGAVGDKMTGMVRNLSFHLPVYGDGCPDLFNIPAIPGIFEGASIGTMLCNMPFLTGGIRFIVWISAILEIIGLSMFVVMMLTRQFSNLFGGE